MHRWLLPLVLTACGPTSAAFLEDEDDTDQPTEDSDPLWETGEPEDTAPPEDTDVAVDDTWTDAWLDLAAPAPGFYGLDADVPLQAIVRDDDGDALPFDDVRWSLEPRGTAVFEGSEGGVTLGAGVYDLYATAALPDGSNLSASVSGVRVQHPRTGIYAGSVVFTTISEIQGQTLRNSCVGALDVTVDVLGEGFDGSGGCVLNLPVVGQIDLSYDIVATIDDPELSGDILVDAVIVDIPVPWEGGFPGPERFEGRFEAETFAFDLEGSLEARRVTRYVDP